HHPESGPGAGRPAGGARPGGGLLRRALGRGDGALPDGNHHPCPPRGHCGRAARRLWPSRPHHPPAGGGAQPGDGAAMSHPAIIAHHLARLQAPAWRPRAQAARLLAPYAAQPPVWEALAARVAQDPNLAVRLQALRRLARLQAPAWRPRAQAARLLAPYAAQPPVWEALAARVAQDPNLAVRIQALRSLARSGRPESLPILEAAVASGPEPLQEHGLSGLAEWGVAAGREEEAFRRLLERIE